MLQPAVCESAPAAAHAAATKGQRAPIQAEALLRAIQAGGSETDVATIARPSPTRLSGAAAVPTPAAVPSPAERPSLISVTSAPSRALDAVAAAATAALSAAACKAAPTDLARAVSLPGSGRKSFVNASYGREVDGGADTVVLLRQTSSVPSGSVAPTRGGSFSAAAAEEEAGDGLLEIEDLDIGPAAVSEGGAGAPAVEAPPATPAGGDAGGHVLTAAELELLIIHGNPIFLK
eukprot:scaffold19.g1859.t1